MEQAALPPIIVVHLVAATYVLILGPVQIFRTRRDKMHRSLGRVWVGAMAVTCLSSFWITSSGGFSWLHALSLFTMLTVTLGVFAAVRHDLRAHRGNMIGSYLGTLGAFIFAAADRERLIQRVSAEDPLGFLLAALLLLATAGALVLTLQRLQGRLRQRVPVEPEGRPAYRLPDDGGEPRLPNSTGPKLSATHGVEPTGPADVQASAPERLGRA